MLIAQKHDSEESWAAEFSGFAPESIAAVLYTDGEAIRAKVIPKEEKVVIE